MSYIQKIFSAQGADFISSERIIKKKLQHVKALVLDWDGVFNAGIKAENFVSSFSEADAMGINLLRFAHWLKHKEILQVFIISGETNKTAIQLAQRDHFNQVFFKIKHKQLSLEKLCWENKLTKEQIAFVYDDVIDISVAKECALRFMVKRASSPLFTMYVVENDLCDYATAHDGGNHAIREICELMMGINKSYEEAVTQRITFSEEYANYLAARNKVTTQYYENNKPLKVKSNI